MVGSGAVMPKDRITRLYVKGLRTLADLELPLDGLTVLIGENGSGKSSVLEACEILRRAAGPQFLSEVNGIHGGLFSLLRHGAQSLVVGARVEAADGAREPLEYELVLSREGPGTVIESEALHVAPEPGQVDLNIIMRAQAPGPLCSTPVAGDRTAAHPRSSQRHPARRHEAARIRWNLTHEGGSS